MDLNNDPKIYHRVQKDMNPTIQSTIKKFLDHSLDRGLINKDIYIFYLNKIQELQL